MSLRSTERITQYKTEHRKERQNQQGGGGGQKEAPQGVPDHKVIKLITADESKQPPGGQPNHFRTRPHLLWFTGAPLFGYALWEENSFYGRARGDICSVFHVFADL